MGQKGLAWVTLPTIWWSATEITSVSGLNDEQTTPYLAVGEKIVMPGPAGTLICASRDVCPSSTAT